MKKTGRKWKEWIKARKKLIEEAVNEGEIVLDPRTNWPTGVCKDCSHWHSPLTPDHKIRRSQGGKHTKDNIDWVCISPPCFCHQKRDQQGDPEGKKGKKKPAWMSLHECIRCKVPTATFICSACGQPSTYKE